MAIQLKQLKDILAQYRQGLEHARSGRLITREEVHKLTDANAQQRYRDMKLTPQQVRDYVSKQERDLRMQGLQTQWAGEPLGTKLAKLVSAAATFAEQRSDWSRENYLLRQRFTPKERSTDEDTQKVLLAELLEETRRTRVVQELAGLTGEQLAQVAKEASSRGDLALLHAVSTVAKSFQFNGTDPGLWRASVASVVAQAPLPECEEAESIFEEVEKVARELTAIRTWFDSGDEKGLAFFDFEKRRLEQKEAQGNGNAEPPPPAAA